MVTLAGRGSFPTPRRGFTFVAASKGHIHGAVVVPALHSGLTARLIHAALDEAMARGCDPVVLDFGDPVPEDEELRVVLAGPHVQVVVTEPQSSRLEQVLAYCQTANADLLIIDADSVPGLDPELAQKIFHGDFDVLVVAGSERSSVVNPDHAET
jgi:hypothetical protein